LTELTTSGVNDTTVGDNSLFQSAIEDSINQTTMTAHESFSQVRPQTLAVSADNERARLEFAEQEQKWEALLVKKDVVIMKVKAQVS